MFRTILTIACACILVITSITNADFPAEEAWRIEFETPATLLGPSWQDDDGQTFFLISNANHVMVVYEEGTVWESPEIPGYISAVNRVDFGVGDGPEIIFTNVYGDSGFVNSLSGEDYEQLFSARVGLRYEDGGEVGYRSDDRRITIIDWFNDCIPDSSRRLVLGNRSDVENWGPNDWYSTGTGGRIFDYSLRNMRGLISHGIGVVTDVCKFDVTQDGELDLFAGSWGYSRYSFGDGASKSFIGIYDNELDTIRVRELARYCWDGNENSRKHPSFFKLNVVNLANNVSFIATAFKDTSNVRLDLLSPDDLSTEMTRVLPSRSIKCLEIYRNNEEDKSDFLICIDNYGWLYSIYSDQLQFVDIIEDFAPGIVDGKIGNFDDDEDLEMAVLTTDAFIMYDLGQLSAPSTSEPPWMPERYAITAAYPNPFNSSTRIEYSISQPGRIALTVHDLIGREVVRLAEGWQNVGTYDLILNADDLPSGSYMVWLEGERGNTVRMIHLVK